MVEQLFQYRDKKKKLQLVKNWYGDKTIRDLARNLKEEKPPPNGYRTHAEFHYVDGYKPLSNIEHSNPSASMAFLQRNKGYYLKRYLMQDELIHVCLKGSFQYFYLVFEAWNDHFGVIESEEIKELFEKAKEYFQQYQNRYKK